MKVHRAILIILVFSLVVFVFAWAPWLDDKEVHDMVFREKAHRDGTMDWVRLPNGTRVYTLICDYNVNWAPFGRWVASCEGGYYVTFWGKIWP